MKSVTPTELNRPVKSEAPKDEKEVGSDLFGVTKPRPNFVSESDNREELDFELGKTKFFENNLISIRNSNGTFRSKS